VPRAAHRRSDSRKDRCDLNAAILEVLTLTHDDVQRNEISLETSHLASPATANVSEPARSHLIRGNLASANAPLQAFQRRDACHRRRDARHEAATAFAQPVGMKAFSSVPVCHET
jgi:hypothetical protein